MRTVSREDMERAVTALEGREPLVSPDTIPEPVLFFALDGYVTEAMVPAPPVHRCLWVADEIRAAMLAGIAIGMELARDE